MRRAVPWITLVVLVVVACLPVAHYLSDPPPADDDPSSVLRYNAALEVDEGGDLEVTETVIFEVPAQGRRGLVRLFDEYDPDAPRSRRAPREVAVVLDGRPARVEHETWQSGRIHVVDLAPGRTLAPGEHTYVLKYEIEDVLRRRDADSSDFEWKVVPSGTRPIDAADLALRLPVTPTSPISCTQGADPCVAQVDATTVTVDVGGLEPRTPVTIAATLPGVAPDADQRQPWPVWLNPVLGPSWWLLTLVVVAAVFAGWLGRRIALGALDHEPGPPVPDGRRRLRVVGVLAAFVAYAVWLTLLGDLMSVVALVPGAFAALALPAVWPGLAAVRRR